MRQKSYQLPCIKSVTVSIPPLSSQSGQGSLMLTNCGIWNGSCSDNNVHNFDYLICSLGAQDGSSLQAYEIRITFKSPCSQLVAPLTNCRVDPSGQASCNLSGGGLPIVCTIQVNCNDYATCSNDGVFITGPAVDNFFCSTQAG